MYILYHFIVCVSNRSARFLVVVYKYMFHGKHFAGEKSLCPSLLILRAWLRTPLSVLCGRLESSGVFACQPVSPLVSRSGFYLLELASVTEFAGVLIFFRVITEASVQDFHRICRVPFAVVALILAEHNFGTPVVISCF